VSGLIYAALCEHAGSLSYLGSFFLKVGSKLNKSAVSLSLIFLVARARVSSLSFFIPFFLCLAD